MQLGDGSEERQLIAMFLRRQEAGRSRRQAQGLALRKSTYSLSVLSDRMSENVSADVGDFSTIFYIGNVLFKFCTFIK